MAGGRALLLFVALLISMGMNALLLVSNSMLTDTLGRVTRSSLVEPAKRLSAEGSALAAQRAVLADELSTLKALLETARGSQTPEKAASPPQTLSSASLTPPASPSSRPEVASIPLMDEDEKARIDALWTKMPKLTQGALLSGDPDAVLRDPRWNPGGRELSPEAREELGRLMRDYTFFARGAHSERLHQIVLPEVERLRRDGAYVEYGPGERPPSLDGVRVSHAEKAPSGSFRIYYFHPDDYPGLYRHLTVCEERERECFVKIYQLVTGS